MKKAENYNIATPLTEYGQQKVERVLKELGMIWGLEKEKELLNIRVSEDDIQDKEVVVRGVRHLWWMNAEHLDHKDVSNILERLKHAQVIRSFEYVVADDEAGWSSNREYYVILFPRDFDERAERFIEKMSDRTPEAPAARITKKNDARSKPKPRFDRKKGKIIFDGKECEIPFSSNQFVLCQTLFELPIGEWLQENDIVDAFFRGKKSQRSFYDAIRLVNEKALRDLKVDYLLEYQSSRVRLRAEAIQ